MGKGGSVAISGGPWPVLRGVPMSCPLSILSCVVYIQRLVGIRHYFCKRFDRQSLLNVSVLYDGDCPWGGPVQVADLFQPSDPGLRPFRRGFRAPRSPEDKAP